MNKVTWGLLGIMLAALSLLSPAAVVTADHIDGKLDVCCAWNATLNDDDDPNSTLGRLTYSVSGGSQEDRATVEDAVEDWETAVNAAQRRNKPLLALTPAPAGAKADITISLKKGGGVIAGMTKRRFDRQWFVKSVTISISLKAFGVANDQDTIGEVARHEVGHALGLGHAHADCDDLMNPTVGGEADISAADVNGVKAAQHWKLVDRSLIPHQPHVSTVACP